MSGRKVILSGPSGVGKDTVINRWIERDSRVARVVAATTRAPREGEVDGVDYRFMTDGEFLAMADAGGFLEHKKVHSARYGTPLETVNQMVGDGQIAILKIDVQGAIEVMGQDSSIIGIFLLPPSMPELEERLRGRGTDSEEKIRLRLENAKQEILVGMSYPHQVINDDLDRCVEEVMRIVEEAA